MKKVKFKLNSETKIPKYWIDNIPESGAADYAVAEIRKKYTIEVSDSDLKKCIGAYSDWDTSNRDDNIDRLIWIATLDCRENNETYWYMSGY